jgi:DNA polymerase III gamma/tau subunit
MRFSAIIGQPRATEALSRALDSHRLIRSLIFHGPEGTGKLATALAPLHGVRGGALRALSRLPAH